MNKVEKIYNKSDSASQYAENYIKYIGAIFVKILLNAIGLENIWYKDLMHNKPIIIIGNGGHFKVLQEVILLNNLEIIGVTDVSDSKKIVTIKFIRIIRL